MSDVTQILAAVRAGDEARQSAKGLADLPAALTNASASWSAAAERSGDTALAGRHRPDGWQTN